MKRISLVTLSLLLFATVLPAQTVTFTSKPYPEGLKQSVKDNMTVDILISVEGQGEAMTMSKASRKQWSRTVLENADGGRERFALEITEAYESENNPMRRPKEVNHDMKGKVFILTRGASESDDEEATWDIELENGDAVSGDDRDYILEEIVKKNQAGFKRMLDGRTMTVGDTLELDESVLQLMAGAAMPEGISLKRATLVLHSLGEVDGEQTGIFDLNLDLLGSSPFMEFHLPLMGRAEAFVGSLWPLMLKLGGELSGEGAHGGSKILGEGMFEATMKATYTQK